MGSINREGDVSLVQETIKIEGMECDHCVIRVGRVIASVEGVVEVDVNLEKKEAVVEFKDDRTDSGEIRNVIREAGYEPL